MAQEFVLKFFTYYGYVYHMLQDAEGAEWMFQVGSQSSFIVSCQVFTKT